LDDTFASILQHGGDLDQLIQVHDIARHRATVEIDMNIIVAEIGTGQPDGACVHRVIQQALDFGEFAFGRGTILCLFDPHDKDQQRVHRHIDHRVDRFPGPTQRCHEFRKRLPVPWQARPLVSDRDLLHVLHHDHVTVLMLCAARCKTKTAIGHHNGRDTVLPAVGARWIPEYLGIIMGMVIQRPRRYDQPGCIHHLDGFPGKGPDINNLSAANSNIGLKAWGSRSVNDSAALQQEVIGRHDQTSLPREAGMLASGKHAIVRVNSWAHSVASCTCLAWPGAAIITSALVWITDFMLGPRSVCRLIFTVQNAERG